MVSSHPPATTEVKNKEGLIKLGTAHQLLQQTIDLDYSIVDPDFAAQLLIMFSYFITAEELWKYYYGNFQTCKGEKKERIIKVIGIWINNCWNHSNEVRTNFLTWVANMPDSEGKKELSEVIRAKSAEESPARRRPTGSLRSKSFRLKKDQKITTDFLEFKATQLAEQLTLKEHTLFSAIHISEFYDSKWTKKNAAMLSPTLQKYIDYFNVMTSWVGTEILFAPTVDQRVITIKRFIQIAKKCYTLNNFNTAFEIVAGLQMVYISRLTETWKFVDKKKRSELEHLTKIFSPQSNYIAYREILSTKKEPINPYLALELRDISLI